MFFVQYMENTGRKQYFEMNKMGERRIRILMAKPGLDGHDRGIKIVSRALRDAGMEVIYTGLHQTPEQIVEAAVQEDVDVIGLSILSGAHTTLFPKIMELLKENRVDIIVFAGGIIPDEDVPSLKNIKIAEIFGPGTNTEDIVKFVKEKVRTQK
jgi:methylmalonyl-CoA mutase C-terminal domain/subunit